MADPASIYGWTLIGPAVHPRDGQPGTVYRTKIGVEVLWCGGSVRTLPSNWREHQSAFALRLATVPVSA
jgi:hypothetical protein